MVVKCFHICEMVLRTLQRKSYCGSLLAFLTQHKTFRSCDKTFYNVWNAASARSIISTSIEHSRAFCHGVREAWKERSCCKNLRPFSIAHRAQRMEGGWDQKEALFSVCRFCQLRNELESRQRPFKPQLWPMSHQKIMITLPQVNSNNCGFRKTQ